MVMKPALPLVRLTLLLLMLLVSVPAGAAVPAPVLKHDLTITLRPADRTMVVRDVIEIPARLFNGGRLTLETASFMTDIRPRLVSGGARLSTASRPGPYGLLWDLSVERPSRSNPIVIEFSYSVVNPRSAQLAIRPEGSLAGGSGDSWYPQLGFPFPDVGRITLNVPPGETAIASGRRTSSRQQEAAGRFVFAVDSPTKFAFAAGPYRRHVSPDGRFSFYTLRERPDAQMWLERSAALVAQLERLYGPPPAGTPSLVEVDFPSIVLGASEQGFILADDSQLQSFDTVYWAHEFAHQWWGLMVRAAPDTPARTLFTEGLAEFSALMVIEALQGRGAIAELRAGRFASVPNSPLDRYSAVAERGGDRSLRDWTPGSGDDNLAMHRLSTSKGAWVLSMLADWVGRDVVLAGLRRLLRQNAGGSASWADVERVLSSAAGRDLEWFFAQWLGRPGAANLRLEWAPAANGTGVSGTVVQPGTSYVAEVEIDLVGPEGATRTEKLRIDGPRTAFRFDPGFAVRRVILDPRFRLFRRPLPSDLRRPS